MKALSLHISLDISLYGLHLIFLLTVSDDIFIIMGLKQEIVLVMHVANCATKILKLLCNSRFQQPPNCYFWVWGSSVGHLSLLSCQLVNVNNVFSEIRQVPRWCWNPIPSFSFILLDEMNTFLNLFYEVIGKMKPFLLLCKRK